MDYPAMPHESVDVGAALFTLVEPHEGEEVAYNRWYERDHFYAGCLIGPLWFAGCRWVATKPLKDLRFPHDTQFLPDISAGSYLATYWIQKGQEQDAIAWGSTQVKWLHEAGRMFEARDHIHTLMYVNRWSVSRDGDAGVPAPLALDHRFAGFVALMVDRNDDVAPRDMSSWLRDELLPARMADTPWALACALTPIPLPEGAPVFQPDNPGTERRMLLMCFLDTDPRECWEVFTDLADTVRDSGKGEISYAAPFIPTIPGTDTYTDQLR
jgi:hypothetical protein